MGADREERSLTKKRYILIFTIAVVMMIGAVFVYLNQLSNTVSGNLMSSIDEISRHDVETIEGVLDNSYARLDAVAKRLEIYDASSIAEAQEQLNLEAASSAFFNAIYLMDAQGTLYSSSYVRLSADEHAYDEVFESGRDRFVMLYEESNGKLETTKQSFIYGIKIDGLSIAEHDFIALLGRSDLSLISDQLLIESFDGQGVSSVVNSQGYYIVSASPTTDLAGRDNFYNVLESGHIEDGVTIEDVRKNISEGKSFVINCTAANGERLVMSFAPVEGTTWSFIMTVPRHVFENRFAPFIVLTASMLVVVMLVLIIMMLVIYTMMKKSILADANAAARSEFLSNMSHEIRTPLNGIIGLNHLMNTHLDDREAMESYVGKLGNAANYLLSLVNDILDVSKLQAGKVDLEHAPFNLIEVIDNVCEMQRETISSRGINFTVNEGSLAYPYVIGDGVRLSQVLMNILSNAAKFTPCDGSITLQVKQTLSSSGSSVTTEISIADTGCGMSPSFQKHIFDEFTQERNINSDSQKGTGLGMAICHLLVQEMGGHIELDSELGHGSNFTVVVDLPIDQSRSNDMPYDRALDEKDNVRKTNPNDTTKTSPANTASSSEASESKPVKLLIAEDNELNADIISSILSENGYDVTLVANGQDVVDAFEASGEGEFAAILMDIHMPIKDGYEASREIRSLDRKDAEKIRIFACTASTFAEDRNKAIDSGMDDFLPKPLNVRLMLAKLEELQ